MNKTFTRLLTHCKASGNLEKSCVMAALKFFSIGAYAQNRTVTGTVGDEGGQRLPFTNFLVKFTSSCDTTDAEGKHLSTTF